MAEFVLKNNYFEFNSNVKHVWNIWNSYWYETFPTICMYIYGVHGESVSQKWTNLALDLVRYIDDILFVWTASEKELDDFLERLNNFHPNLKFTHERSREEINFLDITVRFNHGEFITNLYCKPTDGLEYLHFESCHPSHTKFSIIFSQALRMREEFVLRKVILLLMLESLRTGSRKKAIQRIWSIRKHKGHL